MKDDGQEYKQLGRDIKANLGGLITRSHVSHTDRLTHSMFVFLAVHGKLQYNSIALLSSYIHYKADS